MLARVEKARTREAALLARQTVAISQAWSRYLTAARNPPGLADVLSRRDVTAILAVFDRPIAAFASAWLGAFIDTANLTTAHLGRKLVRKAPPTLGLSFDVSDPVAVALMRHNRLALVQGLTRGQRAVTRAALVRGLERGDDAKTMAARFRASIGLTPYQQQRLDAFENAMQAARTEELALPEADRGIVSTPKDIVANIERQSVHYLRARADAIARTESTRIVGLAQDQALRQSIQAVGQSKSLTGKQWNSTHDGRTRDDHDDSDGQRRRLNEPFTVGGEQIDKPGIGSARNSINCRCVLTYEFFDSDAEMQTWLNG